MSIKFKKYSPWAYACASFVLIVLIAPFFSSAANSSSTSFVVQDAAISTLTGYATSTSYGETAGGFPVGYNMASSTSYTVYAGPLNSNQASYSSGNWRFYDDENHETPSNPFAAENVSPSGVPSADVIKLRLTIHNASGTGVADQKFRLQFSEISDFSSGARDVAEIGSCAPSDLWCYGNGVDNDNDPILNRLLSDSNATGTHNESGVSTSSYLFAASSSAEFEFTIENAGARANATYFFRVVDNATGLPVAHGASSTYPSLSTEGATFTFSVGGLPAGTSTAGIVTTATTTATEIPFGTILPNGSSTIGAHRITVTTDATNGYQVFAYETQNLLSQNGAVIPGVSSTNAVPGPWQIPASSTAAFGYHTTASVLSGGSTRFAADDTYAKFATSSDEIAFSAAPIATSTTDMVYRLETTAGQAAGSYTNSIVYIAVAFF